MRATSPKEYLGTVARILDLRKAEVKPPRRKEKAERNDRSRGMPSTRRYPSPSEKRQTCTRVTSSAPRATRNSRMRRKPQAFSSRNSSDND